jgi:hypothetical protein
MDFAGTDLRKLRLSFGVSAAELTAGICSESYLSLIENDKRPLSVALFSKFLAKLSKFGNGHRTDNALLPSARLALLRSLADAGANEFAVSEGISLVRSLETNLIELEVIQVRATGTLMNSLLELGRTNEARKLLASLPVLKSDLSKLYVNWSHANFHEATGDLGLALESFSAALEIATRLREYATADQMRQATLHTKLLLGLTTDSDDENFLVKGIDSFSEIQDFDSYCLFGCTLALHLYVCGRFDEAKSVILDTIGSLGKMRMRNSGTAYLNALDVLKSLGLDSEALKLLKEASMKLSASDATLSVAHLWNRLSKHATSLRDASISELANSSESRILTRLNSRAS